MTFDAHGIRNIVHGTRSERETTLRISVVWFCAAAFITATLLSVATGYNGFLIPGLAGLTATTLINLIKID